MLRHSSTFKSAFLVLLIALLQLGVVNVAAAPNYGSGTVTTVNKMTTV